MGEAKFYQNPPPIGKNPLGKLVAYTGLGEQTIQAQAAAAYASNPMQFYQSIDFDAPDPGKPPATPSARFNAATLAIAAVWGTPAASAWWKDKHRSWWDQFGGDVIGGLQVAAGAVTDAVSFGSAGTALIVSGTIGIANTVGNSGPVKGTPESSLPALPAPGQRLDAVGVAHAPIGPARPLAVAPIRKPSFWRRVLNFLEGRP